MLGSFAVGKTSLVSRFVHSVFWEKYQTSIGVKIDRKSVQVGERKVELILWDIPFLLLLNKADRIEE
jgi:GTPase SAR1 family protein